MDEFYVMQMEIRAAHHLLDLGERAAGGGHRDVPPGRSRTLAHLWGLLVRQGINVLAPRGAARFGLQVPATGLRAECMLGDDAGHNLASPREQREHLWLLSQQVLPCVYEASTDDELWEMARELDREVDQMGRERWTQLVAVCPPRDASHRIQAHPAHTSALHGATWPVSTGRWVAANHPPLQSTPAAAGPARA